MYVNKIQRQRPVPAVPMRERKIREILDLFDYTAYHSGASAAKRSRMVAVIIAADMDHEGMPF